ncbi:hypothetical protein [Thalassovita sp.]|uniref:hypothetical protein n=1 Tax=Thalassovita sp. TaxID=1979401 RepID=UPI003B5A0060
MIKPILPFRAVVPGSAYPKEFTVEDEFEVDSVEAEAALNLGCLSDEDRVEVSEALGLGEDQTGAEAEAKAKAEAEAKAKAEAEAKAKGAAPENKAGGAKD